MLRTPRLRIPSSSEEGTYPRALHIDHHLRRQKNREAAHSNEAVVSLNHAGDLLLGPGRLEVWEPGQQDRQSVVGMGVDVDEC